MAYSNVVQSLWLTTAIFIAVNVWPRSLTKQDVSNAVRVVTDACGQHVSVPETIRNAILFTPTISEFLFVTRKPDPIISGYDANRISVKESILKRAFPQLLSTRIESNNIYPGTISAEALLRMKPDVVFDWNFRAPYFANLGLPAVCVSNKRNEEDGLFINAKLYADVMGQEGRAHELISRYEQDFARLKETVSPYADAQPRVLFISINGTGRINATFSGLRSNILAMVDGEDLRKEALTSFAILDPEVVLRLNPDILILEPSAMRFEGPTPAEFMYDPFWQSLRAVRNKRVYDRPLGASLFFVGMVETPLFARWLAELLHPDLQPEFRALMRDAYRRELHYTVSGSELDDMLMVDANQGSLNHAQFEALRAAPAAAQ